MDKKNKKKSADVSREEELDIFDELDDLTLPEEEGGEPVPGGPHGARPKPPPPPVPSARHPNPKPPVESRPKQEKAPDVEDDFADLTPDVPVNFVAVIGKVTTSVGELVKLRQGSVVELGRAPGETVDVVANGRLIARGELVEIDGKLGVRIIKMVK